MLENYLILAQNYDFLIKLIFFLYFKDLTETGKRARKVSGTQGNAISKNPSLLMAQDTQ